MNRQNHSESENKLTQEEKQEFWNFWLVFPRNSVKH